ncbi:MAG TPA: helix-turn-helix domain-containing protein [Acetivibrio sp.]|nr:helix-turn-helix domain-containing protein [Acetivibrio sp.]
MFRQYPDVMTVRQLAKALGIGKNKAYEMLKKQVISSIKLGRKYIIPRQYLLDYIEASRYNVKL